MARLALYISGQLIEETDVFIPDFSPNIDFDSNVDIRKIFVDREALFLKANNIRSILKVGKYKIYLTVQSKMNEKI